MMPSSTNDPACPSCGSDQVTCVGNLAPGVRFAGQPLEEPLPGGRLYRCAACHLNPDPVANAHAPSKEDMARFTPNSVYSALSDGLMRLQADAPAEHDVVARGDLEDGRGHARDLLRSGDGVRARA